MMLLELKAIEVAEKKSQKAAVREFKIDAKESENGVKRRRN